MNDHPAFLLLGFAGFSALVMLGVFVIALLAEIRGDIRALIVAARGDVPAAVRKAAVMASTEPRLRSEWGDLDGATHFSDGEVVYPTDHPNYQPGQAVTSQLDPHPR